jgi:TRAP-type C4-dicarboxylate transport system permease small subunit
MPAPNPPLCKRGRAGRTVKNVAERFLELVCMALLATLSVIVMAGVAYRTLGASLVWYDEVASILLAWLTYWGAALAALKRAHIGAPNLVRTLDPPARRAVFVIAEALVIGFFVLLAWVGWQVFEILEGDTLVSLPDVPLQWAQVIIPLGSVLFILAELLAIPEGWREASGKRPPPAPPAAMGDKEMLSTE